MFRLLFATMFVSLCVADTSAFAAVSANRRRQPATSAPTTVTLGMNAATGASSARAAKKPATARAAAPVVNKAAPVAAKTTSSNSARAAVTTKKPTAARAGATQKVINMGTKVSGPTANTVVSQECQDAFYGCMDAFCMLDNTSGGRCQCSDRNAELDLVLEEIMKLDEQSLIMATEGVERLQMGDSADEIMARAKAAANNVVADNAKQTSGVDNKTKARQLDLSAWKNNSLFSDDDDIFDVSTSSSGLKDDFANKTGDDLLSASYGVCVQQMPTQCKESVSFLQLAYAQKIKSDCTAYENSLKQQRNASAEKLQTAQKALREAALEAYQNENKYDFGQCVVQFKSCLQTTAECGEDYSGCVADTAILDALYNKKNSKKGVATTAIKTGATTITVSSATYDILNNKKSMCESVTRQCVNANKKGQVWQQVVKDLAPVIYTAEYNAASNNRMNCISTVVSCVQKACGSKWDEETDNFDACLSDPASIDNYCKLEYQRCGDGTVDGEGSTGTIGSVRSYIMAKLAALKVDKCTQDVKACLLAEEHCGEDYAGCIGFDSDEILKFCPEDSLLSCKDRANGNNGKESTAEYIAKIARGLALNIENKHATTCQNAVNAVFERVCGVTRIDEETEVELTADESVPEYCPDLASIDTRAFSIDLKVKLYDSDPQQFDPQQLKTGKKLKRKLLGLLEMFGTATPQESDDVDSEGNEIADESEEKIQESARMFFDSIDEFVNKQNLKNGDTGATDIHRVAKLIPVITGNIGVYDIMFDENANVFKLTENYEKKNNIDDGYDGDVEKLLSEMNKKYQMMLDKIESDTTISGCMNGRSIQSFNKGERIGQKVPGEKGRFPNLTRSVRIGLADQLLNEVIEIYNKALDPVRDELIKTYDEIKKYVKDVDLDKVNKELCNSYAHAADFAQRGGHWDTSYAYVNYIADKNICVVTTEQFYCAKKWKNSKGCSMKRKGCEKGKAGAPGSWCRSGESTQEIQMETVESQEQ